ncbi:MAG TPA: class I SAM-dependent methyltransferase [Streptosporangiaceae bacterium]
MDNHHHHGAGAAAGTRPAAGHSHGEPDYDALADLLDLDAEVLHSYLSEVTAWVYDRTAGQPIGRILDLGSGTGTGAFSLAGRFPGAEVIAVDQSAEFLARLDGHARRLGLSGRVRTVQADLDAAWPDIGPADLVWASNSIHHTADPDRVLAKVFGTLRLGGHLALAEMDALPRFLPDNVGLGEPGLEARCHAAVTEAMASEVPHLGDDWAARLATAGFTIEAERTFAIDLTPPLPAATARYAQATLSRMRSGLDGRMSPGDLATLDALVDGDGPVSVLHRDDLTVRGARTVWMARRG